MAVSVMGRGLLAAAMLSSLILAQACASADISGGGVAATSGAGRQSPGTASGPAATVGSGEPMGGLGYPVHVRDGKVTVRISSRTYRPGAPVVAVVTNGLHRAIYTQDAKSDCSILLLQRLDRGSWADVTGCALGRPPLVVAIGASHARTVAIDPGSVNFADGMPTATLPPGTYRLRLTYGFGAQDEQEPMATVSPPFAWTS